MARFGAMMFMAVATSTMLIHGVLGGIVCESLSTDLCTFAISSHGLRCVLERFVQEGSEVQLQCRTSQVKVGNIAGWIESDCCVDACGVDRSWVGISSDSLMDAQFLEKLCAAPCFEGCPNIVELYYNLAAAEGAFLPNLCEALKANPRRGMQQALSTFFSNSIASPPSSPPPNPPPYADKHPKHHPHHKKHHHHHHKKHHHHHKHH